MAASTSASRTLSPPATLAIAAPATLRSTVPHRVGLPPLPPSLPARARDTWKSAGYCRKIATNFIAMAVGETLAPAEPTVGETSATAEPTVGETSAPTESTVEAAAELPEIVKNIQEAWDKLEDKYAVSSLAFAGLVGLWGTAGLVSAIDRLLLLPGLFELVGIGYSGWFAYRNLVFKSNREALLAKIKCTYEDIVGTSG